MQVVSQDGTKAVTYKGVSLGTGSRGMTVLSILTEGGQAYAMGHFIERKAAKRVVAEIILSAAEKEGKEVYYVPAE